jgi:hypothetical protein
MGNPTRITLAVLFLVLCIALPEAYGGMMEGGKTGFLSGIEDHNASGKVTITKDEAGNHVLTLSDIKIDEVPDGRVYLAKKGDHTKGVEVGRLNQFTGTVQFPIPSGVNPDDYDSVVIWCEKFSVGIGHTFLK